MTKVLYYPRIIIYNTYKYIKTISVPVIIALLIGQFVQPLPFVWRAIPNYSRPFESSFFFDNGGEEDPEELGSLEKLNKLYSEGN